MTSVGISAGNGLFIRNGTNSTVQPLNTLVTAATDDFVFGSFELDDDGAVHDSRFLFDKSKAAFRAGTESDEWDEARRGEFSTAFGRNTVANGSASFAAGNGIADADFSIALGDSVTAQADNAVVIGHGNSIADPLVNNYGSGNGSLVVDLTLMQQLCMLDQVLVVVLLVMLVLVLPVLVQNLRSRDCDS